MVHLKDGTKKFPLSHLMLYTRGWYESTDDLFSDLKVVLGMDGYSPQDKQDVMYIIVNCFGSYFNYDLVNFLNDLQESQSWKIGHYTKNNSNPNNHYIVEYDYQTAIIRKILSEIRFLETKTWNPVTPCYSKGLKKPKRITIRGIYEMFVEKKKKDMVY